MQEMYGAKEFYDVTIRANQPFTVGDRKFDTNEALLIFDTAEIATVDQIKTSTQARGGYHNTALINWDNDREVRFAITSGVLSPISWALLSNSKLSKIKETSVPFKEKIDVVEDGDFCYADLKYYPNACLYIMGVQPNPCFEPLPMGRRPELMLKPLPPSKTKYIFCYDEETGQRIRDFEIYMNRIYFKRVVRHVIVDYTFDYKDNILNLEVGNRLYNGFLSLDGKINVKGDIYGHVNTAILKIPKIKIESSLSLRLGKQYDEPVISNFYFSGYFDEQVRRDNQKIWELFFLNMDVENNE